MTNAMCLRCDNYQFKDTPFIDGVIKHPRLSWECVKGLQPYVADDGDYCNERIPR